MAIDKKKSNEELIIEAKSFFETYKKEVGESIRKGRKVVFVNFDDIASNSPVLAEALIGSPEEILQILEVALEETGLIKNPRIRFNNLPETQKVKIRTIRANHLNQLIFFEGLVRQASDVRPQVVNAKFECPSCGTVISVLQIEKKFREPTRCSCGRKGQFNLLSKTMVDAQRLVIEEAPESLVGGEQPRRISIFLKEDLVEPIMEEKTTPGSKVRVLGVLKEVPIPLPTGSISTRFDLAIEANNLIPLESTYEDLEISEEDERQIMEISADPELFKRLRESIAPSIWGYEEIKEALTLQMFGGVRKTSPDGTVSRGDVHIFLIGDPGVAKSTSKDAKIMYISDKETGYDSIENIFNKFNQYPKNLKVLTIDMKSQEPIWENVTEIIKHLPEKDLIKIITEHGKSIIATKDHSFITLSKEGNIIPIKGNELTKNNYLPLPANYHKKGFEFFIPGHFNKKLKNSKLLPERISLDKNFGFFIGIFLAEGCITSEKVIRISNKNKEIQNKLINFAKKININYNQNINEISLFSKNLADILYNYCYNETDLHKIKKGVKGNYSRIKKIPEFAFFSPKEFIYGLLSGLFSGDGRLIKDKKMLKGFELITVSKNLAEDTSDLLFSIGILNKTKSRKYNYKNKETNYYSITVPTYMITKFNDNIEIIGRDFKLNKNNPIYSYNNLIPCGELIYKVVKKLGYNSRKTGNRTLAAEMRTVKKRGEIGRLRLLRLIKEFELKTKENIPELETLKKIANSNIIWSKINNIEILDKKNEEVYDLSIPTTNTFVANGIGVHNSVTLKFVSNMAPRGRYIVGKAASGAGITATVVKDEFLKGWALEAGAMVLANKGIVCIDEIEKMDPNDRSAMHEALEQQTVTISKANVQACYSEDTEVLTEEGWKKYNEVKDLKIAQFNPENKIIKFLSHKGLYIYDYNGEMYHFRNKRNDVLVTPNHKMLIKEERQKNYKAIEAEKIDYNNFYVYSCRYNKNKFIINKSKIKKEDIQKIDYYGKVFCFSTKTGFFITRRNGKIAIQGNTLSAQTSVLAAGNPKFGRFEPTQTINQQIDLPPALINRFDLIFILRDLPNKFQDDAIATHVLNIHQRKDKKSDIDRELFRKYVAYAKQKIEPRLTDEAVSEIKDFYIKMRNASTAGEAGGSISISARQLQGLVRLAEAHAKSRLSPVVEKQDAHVAIRLTKYYLMQVGYDPETKKFDIDRFTTKMSSSQRSKVFLIKETLKKLEDAYGKQIPMDILREELKDMSDSEFEEAMAKLEKEGQIFHPKQGFIQEVSGGH